MACSLSPPTSLLPHLCVVSICFFPLHQKLLLLPAPFSAFPLRRRVHLSNKVGVLKLYCPPIPRSGRPAAYFFFVFLLDSLPLFSSTIAPGLRRHLEILDFPPHRVPCLNAPLTPFSRWATGTREAFQFCFYSLSWTMYALIPLCLHIGASHCQCLSLAFLPSTGATPRHPVSLGIID